MNESSLHELPGSWVWTRLGLRTKKPQINADERRLIVFDFETLFEVYSGREMQSPWIMQSGQIFTDLCASVSSVQSVFYRLPSAFICVHPRLIFNREMRERGARAG